MSNIQIDVIHNDSHRQFFYRSRVNDFYELSRAGIIPARRRCVTASHYAFMSDHECVELSRTHRIGLLGVVICLKTQ